MPSTFALNPMIDTFTRSVSSGLGVSDSGHTWTTTGNGWAADGTAAVVEVYDTIGTARRALISATDSIDRHVDLTATFRPIEPPTGGSIIFTLVARLSGSTSTLGSYRMNPNGTGDVAIHNSNTAATYIPGPAWTGWSVVNVRFWLYENNLRLKVWFGDKAQPENWTHQVTLTTTNMTGQSGFQVTPDFGLSNALSYYIMIDPVAFTGAKQVNDILDTFSRDATSDLGVSDSGHDYTGTFGGGAPWSVSLATGTATANLNGTAAMTLGQTVGSDFQDVRGVVTMKTSADTNAITSYGGVYLRYDASNDYILCKAEFNHTTEALQLTVTDVLNGSTVTQTVYSSGAFTHNTYYKLKAEALGDRVRAKIWLASGGEPNAWQIDRITGVPRVPSQVALAAGRNASGGSVTSSIIFDRFDAQDIALQIEALPNDNLDSPGVNLVIRNGNLYHSVRVDRTHVPNLYETATVRGLANILPPSSAFLRYDYEMPLDEPVIYTVYALDDSENVVTSDQSEEVVVEVPYHRTIVRSIGDATLSRRVQITEFDEFTRALRVVQEAKVLGVKDPVVTFDVVEGMTGSFTCMNVLDQEAAGLALRKLFFEGQPLMFQTVMRTTGVPDFFFIAKSITPVRHGTIHPDQPPRYLYQIEFQEVARPPAELFSGGNWTWQTLLDAGHTSWQSVFDTHNTWLSVLADANRPPAG